MCLEEYDEEKTLKMLADEAREDGLKEGIEAGMKAGKKAGIEEGMKAGKKAGHEEAEIQAIERMLKKLAPDEIVELGYDKEQVMKIYNSK